MLSCTNGHFLARGTAFCGVCGEDVRPCCAQGHPNTIGARFCSRCGTPVTEAGPPVTEAGAPVTGTAADAVPDTAQNMTSLVMAPSREPAGADPYRTGAEVPPATLAFPEQPGPAGWAGATRGPGGPVPPDAAATLARPYPITGLPDTDASSGAAGGRHAGGYAPSDPGAGGDDAPPPDGPGGR